MIRHLRSPAKRVQYHPGVTRPSVPLPAGQLVGELAGELTGIVGAAHVLRDPDLRAGYERDWTGRFGASALAVVRPGSADEVAAVLAACAARRIAVVPQGGNTGLVGGGVPRGGEIVLSTRRLDWVGEVDVDAAQLSAGGGATLAALQERARAHGLDVGVDFAARGSATLGGAIATNAGGSRVVRFGPMRTQLTGVEMALASGALVGSLAGLPKDSAGIHLPSLVAGSEGTLGVITAARLRLVPRYRRLATALIALASPAGVAPLVGTLRRELADLDQVELMLDAGVALVCAARRLAVPVARSDSSAYVLVECASHQDPLPALLDCLGSAPDLVDVAVAGTPAQREQLRAVREGHTEAISGLGVPLKLDIAVPLHRLADCCAELTAGVGETSPASRLFLFGHAAEANLHVNVVGPPSDWERLTDLVLGVAVAAGGTVSAEHGIGVAKASWLRQIRSPAELELQIGLRRIVDPHGVLNPGVLDPP